MKFLIASDLHGSACYCEQLLNRWKAEGADRLLLLGDLLYHGPRNDLPRDYAPKRVIELLNPLRDKILCVRGNCEAEVDQMVLEFPVMADYALLEMGGLCVYATHGHVVNTTKPLPFCAGDILLHGHTHVPAWEDCGGWWYLNPGSTSIPKSGSRHSYMTFDEGVFLWKDLETGEVYHELSII